MMNLIELQEALKSLPDEVLHNYMKDPPAHVPQFLAIAELGRRKKMESAAQPNKQIPTTTVADDLIQSRQQGQGTGIASIPPRPQAAPVQRFRDGGVVGNRISPEELTDSQLMEAKSNSFKYGLPVEAVQKEIARRQKEASYQWELMESPGLTGVQPLLVQPPRKFNPPGIQEVGPDPGGVAIPPVVTPGSIARRAFEGGTSPRIERRDTSVPRFMGDPTLAGPEGYMSGTSGIALPRSSEPPPSPDRPTIGSAVAEWVKNRIAKNRKISEELEAARFPGGDMNWSGLPEDSSEQPSATQDESDAGGDMDWSGLPEDSSGQPSAKVPPTKPKTPNKEAARGGIAGALTSENLKKTGGKLPSEIAQAYLDKLSKMDNDDTTKWLRLAEFGAAMAGSTRSDFAGALGEAGMRVAPAMIKDIQSEKAANLERLKSAAMFEQSLKEHGLEEKKYGLSERRLAKEDEWKKMENAARMAVARAKTQADLAEEFEKYWGTNGAVVLADFEKTFEDKYGREPNSAEKEAYKDRVWRSWLERANLGGAPRTSIRTWTAENGLN